MSRDAVRWSELVFADSAILVSPDQPGAIIRRDGVPDQLVSWPDLDVGARAPSLTLMRGTTGAWAMAAGARSRFSSIQRSRSTTARPRGLCSSPATYAAVHLSEDLETVDPSSLGSGRDGILDF